MGLIPALVAFTPDTDILSADVNANFASIRSAFNTTALLTDVARTITVTHTYTASQTFTAGAAFGAPLTGTSAAFSSVVTAASAAIVGACTAASLVAGADPGGAELVRAASGRFTSLTGTLATAAQPNITSVGTLASLTVSGALAATLTTAAQPNITSLGTLTSLTVSGTAILGADPGGADLLRVGGSATLAQSGRLRFGSGLNGTGKYVLRAGFGSPAALELVNAEESGFEAFRVGTLYGSLAIIGTDPGGAEIVRIGGGIRINGSVIGLAGAQFNGTVSWGTDNTFDIGTLGANRPRTGYFATSLLVGADPGGAELVRAASGRFTSLTGTLATAAQPNITSVGTLASLTVSGALAATLTTAAQPNITSLGTLASLTVSGTATATRYAGVRTTNAAAGATPTVTWSNGNHARLTLTANVTTLTLAAPAVGVYTLELIQGAGPYTVVWPASVVWAGGVAPTLTSTNGRKDVVTLFYNGTEYLAGIFGQNYVSSA